VKAYIALGSNLGNAAANLEKAGGALAKLGRGLRASPIFRTPALLPENGPAAWKLPFQNAVVEMEWPGTAPDLLRALKRVELELGREPSERWAPRLIDLDLLALGQTRMESAELTLPHPEAGKRSFVLDPLKHLVPGFRFPGQSGTVLERSRSLPKSSPLWMGILNCTPDSFSDGGALADMDQLRARVDAWESAGVQMLDFGAESTRPGAAVVEEAEEWARLAPCLVALREKFHGRIFRPLVSVDTRHARVAASVLEMGAGVINDVSGGSAAMLEVLKSSSCQYVLMHSLSVPASPKLVLAEGLDPVGEVLRWAEGKLEGLEKAGISLDRVLLDPGVGFGKTAAQSLEIVRRAEELLSLPVRVLLGHSRKSFFRLLGEREARDRDGFTLGASMRLASKGIDVIRVHEAALHSDAWHAYREVEA
jgi:2-amino-4-hydroxy-6-hydroxymethyldihydropteridine diphosphokinase / dihydropteroate synthase